MSKELTDYLAACAQAYNDGRRNSVEQAIGTLKRIPITDAIEAYTLKLIKNRKDVKGANPAGRNSHSYNTRLVLLKLARDMEITHLNEITRERVSAYMDGSPLSPKTRRGYKSSMDGLIKFARQRGWLSSDPLELLDSPSLPPGEIQYVKLEDFPRVLEAVAGKATELPIALAGLAGIRRCEIVRLAPSDVRWKDREILIRPEVSKTNRQRYVPMSDRLAEVVERCGMRFGPVLCVGPKSGAAWHEPALTISAQRALKKSGIKTEPSGIPLVKAGVFNTLRHGAITYWLEAGKRPDKVAKWAGNSLLVIEKHYAADTHCPDDADDADFMKAKQAN